MPNKTISLGQGSGGKAGHNLIKETVLKYLKSEKLAKLGDASLVHLDSKELAFSTDSYVIQPIFFQGGDIGKLSMCGTINDLAVSGAKPLYLSLSFIIEEGFKISELEKILKSIGKIEKEYGVEVITGDTKIVEQGACDKIFINTAGIGQIIKPMQQENIEVDNVIIINGSIGDHGAAIISQRENLNIKADLDSDCAPLNKMTQELLEQNCQIKFMRDPTRGGVAAVLNEIALEQNLHFELEEQYLPIKNSVNTISELLGLDPMYMANEGKVIIFATADDAENIIKIMQKHPQGHDAKIIGTVLNKDQGLVTIKTELGTSRILDWPNTDPLPRIC